MRKNFGVKPYLYPQPVFIIGTYGENNIPNAMNAAWGGMSEENQITMCLSRGHKTTKNILNKKAFTVSMATASTVVECDYFGIVSGNQEPNKIEKAGFTVTKSEFVDAPIINELPMTLECRFISYDEQTCQMIGEIVNISADEKILTDGKIDPEKLEPISYDPVNHYYLKVSQKVGNAYIDGKKLKNE